MAMRLNVDGKEAVASALTIYVVASMVIVATVLIVTMVRLDFLIIAAVNLDHA